MSELADTLTIPRCTNCNAALVGAYCHECGQKRIVARLSLRDFFSDIARRVFRFDKALISTLARALRNPGLLAEDYLAGRRRAILDPVNYYASTVFVQFLVVALTRSLAPLMDRMSALNWLGAIGGIVATRIVAVFWMGALWQILFRPTRHNLAETYVFALYGFGTIGILWTLLPLVDLAVPVSLGENAQVVAISGLALEVAYFTFGAGNYARTGFFGAFLRVALVFALSYAVLYLLAGAADWHDLLLPPMPAD